MRISVINLTHGLLSDKEVITAIRAINRQVNEDFAPYWNMRGQLRLEGTSADKPDTDHPDDMQGEAIIYLWDKSDVPDALGYHEINYKGIPYGFVFVDIANDLGESWTVTLSHEVLELLGDRQANRLIRGPHPTERSRNVMHWHEMCDAVQSETYEIDGVEVSNFVLPLYFTPDAEPGSRNDFLGTAYRAANGRRERRLPSFGINPGGYVGFMDPRTNKYVTEMGPEVDHRGCVDETKSCSIAAYRRLRKNKARMARRGNRYAEMGETKVLDIVQISKNESVLLLDKPGLIARCKHSALTVASIPLLMEEERQQRGYFANNIYANARSVAQKLQDHGFEEISALQIDPVTKARTAAQPQAELEITHAENEVVIAVVDIEGVLFVHPPGSTRTSAAAEPKRAARKTATGGKGKAVKKQVSTFTVPVQSTEPGAKSRRGFTVKAAPTIVRLVKHKLTDRQARLMSNDFATYLAEVIEKEGFKKEESGKMLEIVPLPLVKNHRLGEVVELRTPLAPQQKYLLLIHGTFSSVEGAFAELLLNRWDDNLLPHLITSYDRIIGFEHWTVAKTPLENATELLALLPDNCQIDIVNHSRGATVTRCLLEHPDLAPQLAERNIKLGKALFVAGVCQGTELAHPDHLFDLLNTFSALSSLAGSYLPLTLFTGLLKAVQYGLTNFPGLTSIAPQSPLFQQLNQARIKSGGQYIVSRSNYEPSGKLAAMLEGAGIDRGVFNNKRNDGVVPFEGAGTFDAQIAKATTVVFDAEFGVTEPGNVYHTQFFAQPELRQMLMRHLR